MEKSKRNIRGDVALAAAALVVVAKASHQDAVQLE